jgi:hypothetical protein
MTQQTNEMPQEPAVQHGGALVRVVAHPSEIVAALREFQELKRQILTEADYQVYTQRVKVNGKWENQPRKFVKKSGWRNIARSFGISLEKGHETVEDLPEGYVRVTWTVRAIAPSGQFCEGVGACDSKEDRFQAKVYENGQHVGMKTEYKFHDITSTAYTRAANRAISDLVGGGEVSAEEVSTSPDIVNQPTEPELLPAKFQKRLADLAADKGVDGAAELARLVLAELGTKFLTVEQATKIGNALKSFDPAAANRPAEPSGQVVETEAREIQEDEAVPFVPCPKCDGPMDASGKVCTAKGCGYRRA